MHWSCPRLTGLRGDSTQRGHNAHYLRAHPDHLLGAPELLDVLRNHLFLPAGHRPNKTEKTQSASDDEWLLRHLIGSPESLPQRMHSQAVITHATHEGDFQSSALGRTHLAMVSTDLLGKGPGLPP